jgi:ribonucleoside-triphosphate reductase
LVKRVIKRNGDIAEFDKEKIKIAIGKAMLANISFIDDKVTIDIANEIENNNTDTMDIHDIETDVFNKLCEKNYLNVAKAYESYRSVRSYQREKNSVDNKILGLINGKNKQTLNDNSNKNHVTISTVRDLTAEEVSKDIALRLQFPPHLTQAHLQGIIYKHDIGHFINKSLNCCLINLKDMLTNGTVINEKMIESPKSFQTACTIATQIIAQVASGQFGKY